MNDGIFPNELRGNTYYVDFDKRGVDITDKRYKADNTGLTDISDILSSISSDTIYIPSGVYLIDKNITIAESKRLVFSKNARLKIASGKTLTINGSIESHSHNWIFDQSLGGNIIGSPKLSNVYPQWFGAKGDGSSDDTIPFKLAIAYAGYLGTIIVPKGYYKLTDTLDFRSRRLIGSGMDQTVLNSFSPDKAVIMTGGVMCYVGDITVRHNDRDTALAQIPPAGVGILVKKLGYGSVVERVEVIKNSAGIYQSDAGDVGNYQFSGSYRDLVIGQFSYAGFYSKGPNTGSVFDNIYIYNWDDVVAKTKLPAKWGMYFQTSAQNTMRQINVEHGLYETGIEVVDCSGFVMNSVHFEGLDPKTNGGSICSLIKSSYHSSIIISGFSYSFSKIDSANLSNFCMIQIADDTRINMNGVDIHDITLVNATNRRRVIAGGTILLGANVHIDNMKMDVNLFASSDSIDPSYTYLQPIVSTTARVGYDTPSNLVIGASNSLYSELRGNDTYNGDGSTATRTIAHGLGVTPKYWNVFASSSAAVTAGIKGATADNTNLYVTFAVAPITGVNNVRLNWHVMN